MLFYPSKLTSMTIQWDIALGKIHVRYHEGGEHYDTDLQIGKETTEYNLIYAHHWEDPQTEENVGDPIHYKADASHLFASLQDNKLDVIELYRFISNLQERVT